MRCDFRYSSHASSCASGRIRGHLRRCCQSCVAGAGHCTSQTLRLKLMLPHSLLLSLGFHTTFLNHRVFSILTFHDHTFSFYICFLNSPFFQRKKRVSVFLTHLGGGERPMQQRAISLHARHSPPHCHLWRALSALLCKLCTCRRVWQRSQLDRRCHWACQGEVSGCGRSRACVTPFVRYNGWPIDVKMVNFRP